MVAQLVSLSGFRQPTTRKLMQEPSYGERGNNPSLSQRRISRKEKHKSFQCGSSGKKMEGNLQRPRWGDEKQLVHRLGLWFLTYSSVSYALKKAKVMLYKRFSFDASDHPRMEFEASLVDAYFSIPVVPATTTAPPHVI
ncbi:hypothetical protein CsSME_00049419 [Camellia sinensis var. sinensis]